MKLYWPPSILNPNSIAHWNKKSKAKAKYKSDCYYLTIADGKRKFPDGMINLRFTFYPPDNRRRDLDNAFAAMKSAVDGIAEAWGVDDSRFFFQILKGEVTPPGSVKVEVI